MTKIKFYNGLREIGGTFVVIETESARCMFDFGFAVADRLDDKIQIRKEDYAADYARLGVLVCQDGIYDRATADKLGICCYEDADKENFFVISHMHIDHMGGLGCLDENIPVYMSEDSLKLYRRLEANGDIEMKGHKNCIGVPYQKPFTIGDITVTAVAIDHDVVGACGFLIRTPDGTVCYTGDYRFHGFHPEVSEAFGKTAQGVDVLITEGVTVSHQDVDMLSLEKPEEMPRTEWDLQQEIRELAKEKDGLLVINPYNRNVERMHRLIHTAEEAGRVLVLDGRQADYVREFYPEDEISVYEKTQKGICAKENGWNVVSLRQLLLQPEKYMLQLDYADMFELLDLASVTSCYVHMDGAPLGDYDPSFNKMKKILEYLQIPYDYRGLGGHSRPYWLRTMIDQIAPKTLIPLHSFRPEQVCSKMAGCRILPEYGAAYELKDGKLKRIDEE